MASFSPHNPETIARRLVRDWLNAHARPFFPTVVLEDLVRRIAEMIREERAP